MNTLSDFTLEDKMGDQTNHHNLEGKNINSTVRQCQIDCKKNCFTADLLNKNFK